MSQNTLNQHVEKRQQPSPEDHGLDKLAPEDAAVIWGGDIGGEIGCDLTGEWWPPFENCKIKITYS